MKKFDLQTALNHPEKVTDSCNNKFVKFYLIKELKKQTQLMGIQEDGGGMWYTEKGNVYHNSISEFDLCMRPEEKVSYVNVYANSDTGPAHDSIELVKKNVATGEVVLCILKITIIDGKDVTTEIVHKY
jgi:hypothetical protein